MVWVWNEESKTVMDSSAWGDKEGPLIYNQVYVWTDNFYIYFRF